jgi:hypothetical protein
VHFPGMTHGVAIRTYAISEATELLLEAWGRDEERGPVLSLRSCTGSNLEESRAAGRRRSQMGSS